MSEWKTMREVAQELGVSKRVVKYHREKLSVFETRLENGIVAISPQGVEKIKGFIRPKEYSQAFETEVLQRLEVIEERLGANDFENREPKEVIRSFWRYLVATSNVAEVLEELAKESESLDGEYDFYKQTGAIIESEIAREESSKIFHSLFGSD